MLAMSGMCGARKLIIHKWQTLALGVAISESLYFSGGQASLLLEILLCRDILLLILADGACHNLTWHYITLLSLQDFIIFLYSRCYIDDVICDNVYFTNSFENSFILFLKDLTFWFNPKGILVKRYCPNGIFKVHNNELSVSSSTCQYSSLKSKVENPSF